MVCCLATRQVSGLSNLFDCLRHVSAEVTLRFEPDALRVAELAGTNTLYIYAELFATHFESYEHEHGDKASAFVVSTQHVHTLLASITRRVRGDADVLLQLTFATKKGGRCGTLTLALLSASAGEYDTTYELPCRVAPQSAHDDEVQRRAAQLFTGAGYAHTMYMSQRHLSHLVSHVFPLGQYIELRCESQAVHFSVTDKHAMISRAHVCFRMAAADTTDNDDGRAHDAKKRKVSAPTSQAGDADRTAVETTASPTFCFSQPLLTMLVRAMSLYNTTAVLLPGDEDEAVIMRSTVGDLGTLSVAIAQVITTSDADEDEALDE